jgi:phosphatidylinositol alpha-mannosyltransferase
MKIVLVSPYDFAVPGGVTEHVTQLDGCLRRLGHETTILAPASRQSEFRPPPHFQAIGRVVCVPTNGSVARITLSLGMSRTVHQILGQIAPDVVHVHEPFMPLLPLVALRHSRATNVATFHAYSGNQLGYRHGRLLLHRFFTKLNVRIAVSQTARTFVERHFPAPFEVIPNGVDLARFDHATARPELLDGVPNILFVGRLDERKGFAHLVRAFARVRQRGTPARLVVVGAFTPGQAARYRRLVTTSGVPDVIFVGRVTGEELTRYYRSSDLVCVPSVGGESFGIVLLEAMAAGRPLIASDIPGYRELIDDGVQGLLVPPGDAEALAVALGRLLADRALRDHLGTAGRAKAERFAWPRVAAQIVRCYNRAEPAGYRSRETG